MNSSLSSSGLSDLFAISRKRDDRVLVAVAIDQRIGAARKLAGAVC